MLAADFFDTQPSRSRDLGRQLLIGSYFSFEILMQIA
jgi:hypothetical protein